MSGFPPTRPRIAVTLGDPAGIGPEVTAAALDAGAFDGAEPVLIGPAAALSRAAEQMGIRLPDGLETVDTGASPPPPGRCVPEGGKHALKALEAATRMALAGQVDALVTAPLSKEAVRMGGDAGFTGHTEYLAEATGCPVHMMMTGGPVRVVLATTHHPLASLPALLDRETVLGAIRAAHEALQRHGGIPSPHIAVCGLNPHPGEFGDEDARAVAPAVEAARALGIRADGPLSADAVFARQVKASPWDGIVAMYHDQGLIPVKMARGVVNITLGLPFIRTAPGHGTAFDIAGTGTADPSDMIAAARTAVHWAASSRRVQEAG